MPIVRKTNQSIAVGLVDLRLQHRPHVPRLDARGMAQMMRAGLIVQRM